MKSMTLLQKGLLTAKHATPALAGGARESAKIFEDPEHKSLSL